MKGLESDRMMQPLSQLLDGKQLRHLSTWLWGTILVVAMWLSGLNPAQATGVYDIPDLAAGDSTWVIDQADVLSRLTEGNLSTKLQTLAQDTDTEARFVTIRRLDYGETIESFTEKLFEKWFPTAEAQANQILMVLDNVTNNTAIQTGQTVKSLLPDETAESVAQETVMVPLRNGNKYNQALTDATDRLVAILTGEPDPGPPIVELDIQTEGTFATAEETDDRSATIIVVGLLIVATIIPMATYFLYQVLQS